MAKHRKRRGRPLFVPRIKASAAAGALAAADMTSTAFGSALDQEVYALSMDVVLTTHGFTAGEGPIIVGVAHGDYSAAEIEEWLEEASSWIKSNKIGQERARRKCRIIAASHEPALNENFNDGKPIRVKLGFVLEDGQQLQLWVYNDSDATLTTGGIVELTGPAYLRPQ